MTDLFSAPDYIDAHGFRYVREDLHKPQFAPDFDMFWGVVPKGKKNGSKVAARKAWGKLPPALRSLAHERVGAFYSLTKEERIGAQEMHVSTYLNSHAFEEEAVIAKMSKAALVQADPMETAASLIRTGKHFLCGGISSAQVRALLAAGLVTADQCRAVGKDV